MRIGTQCSVLGVLVSSLIFVACGGGTTGDSRRSNSGAGGGGGTSSNSSSGGAPVIIVGNSMDCGNGKQDANEGCDDGNKVGKDGCSASCQIEADYVCKDWGQPCTSTAVCGNGSLSSAEACDDGNTNSGDGCSGDCKSVDAGWQCRVPGKPCVPLCGDGKITASEKCDDGNTNNGDGCSLTCLIEPGWSCDSSGKCTKSVCGNGMQEAGESCDKGMAENGHFYGDGSGCSKTCTKEPTCRDASGNTTACTTRCGDANVDPDEKCDDGNQVDGDGCSKDCKEEGGFTCAAAAKTDTTPCTTGGGNCLALPITYRDFDGVQASTGHPDFFFYGATPAGGTKLSCIPNASGANLTGLPANGTCPPSDATDPCRGLVKDTLGSDGKPALGTVNSCKCTFTDWDGTGVLAGATGVATCSSGAASPQYVKDVTVKVIQSADSFKQWYSDSDKSTKSSGTLELAQVGATKQYQFSSSNGRTVYDDIHDIWTSLKSIPSTTPQPHATTLSSGFFPLESSARPKLCNLWPYWKSGASGLASCIASDGNVLTQQWDPRGWNSGQASGPNVGEALGTPVKPVTGVSRNFYFTSEARYLFRYVGGETLGFFGDDDVWVFINGKLVLDLGAPHERMKGTVTLTTTGANWAVSIQSQTTGADVPIPGSMGSGSVTGLNLEVGKTYEIAIFHADRHPRESNYQLTLSGYDTSTSQCTPRCGDGVATAGEECDLGAMNADNVYGGCTTMCKFGPFCGDGIKNGDEGCDKGKDNGGAYGSRDGCTVGCQVPHFCGDGIVDAANAEECDLGSANTAGGVCDTNCHYKPL
ncbi:MAG: DUF4215 domain-containing protein [Polyangiaceae bacterium]